jgi:hypothetical protein
MALLLRFVLLLLPARLLYEFRAASRAMASMQPRTTEDKCIGEAAR